MANDVANGAAIFLCGAQMAFAMSHAVFTTLQMLRATLQKAFNYVEEKVFGDET